MTTVKDTTAPTPAFSNARDIFEQIDIDLIHPSATNPRTHFDTARQAEMEASIRSKGVIEPIVVRRDGKQFEIVAGERRYRAAVAVGLAQLPCVIRAYTDEQVLEIQLEENIHRRDLTPLEEAGSIRRLMDANPTKFTAEAIAVRVGMSPAWVWDTVKLFDLVKPAKALLEEERMTRGHAVLISRLKHEDQLRVIAADDVDGRDRLGGLWQHDNALDLDDDPQKKPGKYDGLKAVSIRELQKWIDEHIRFDVHHAAKAAPLEFEAVEERVQQAEAKTGRGKKVIAITFEHYVQPEARGEERTFGPRSFKFADGQEHVQSYPRKKYIAKACEHSVLGVVAAGEQRGAAFDVCIARDKCLVHWSAEIKQREKTEKLRASGKNAKAKARESAEQKRREAEDAKERALEQRYNALKPALRTATLAAVDKLKTLSKPQFAAVLKAYGLPPATTVAQLPKALLAAAVTQGFREAYFWGDKHAVNLQTWPKLLGVDIKACEPKTPAKEKA